MESLRQRVEDVLLNRRPDATERLVEFAEQYKARRTALGRSLRDAARELAQVKKSKPF